MINLKTLYAFKVKTCTEQEFMDFWISGNSGRTVTKYCPGTVMVDDTINKEWMVVGIIDDWYLLARSGEIAQWFPRVLCKVVDVPA